MVAKNGVTKNTNKETPRRIVLTVLNNTNLFSALSRAYLKAASYNSKLTIGVNKYTSCVKKSAVPKSEVDKVNEYNGTKIN